VRDFGDRAVTAGGHYHRRTTARSFTCQCPGVPRTMCFRQLDADTVRQKDIEHAPQQVGAPQARDRVENDDHRNGHTRESTKRIGSFSRTKTYHAMEYIAE
jgi:hypothetical protein